MKKNILWVVLLFYLINLLATFISDAQGFRAVFQGVAGLDIQTGNFTMYPLLLSLSTSLVFIFTIMNVIDRYFTIAPYIVIRGGRKGLLRKMSLELLGIIFILAFIKFLLDLYFSYPLSNQEMYWLLFIFLFYIVTFIFWSNVIIVMLLNDVKKSVIYFTVIIILLFLQAFSSNKYISLFITASIPMTENVCFIIICKFLLLIVSYTIMFWQVTYYEFKGDA